MDVGSLLWDDQYVKNMYGSSHITAEYYLSLSHKVQKYSPEELAPDALK